MTTATDVRIQCHYTAQCKCPRVGSC